MLDKLYTITVLELFLGGGGRFTAIGPVTLRMLLFACFLYVGALTILVQRRETKQLRLAYAMVLLYLLVHVPGLISAAIRGVDIADAMTEFQQSLYWLGAPVFALVLRGKHMIARTATLVRLAGVVLAVGYLVLIAAIATGVFDVKTLFQIAVEGQELSSRGEGLLFYKGFLYLGIAIIFFVSMRVRLWVPAVIIIAIALVFTLTRGYILSTSIAVLVLLLVQKRKWAASAAVAGILAVAFMVWVYFPSGNEAMQNSRIESNSIRLDDMSFMANHATAATLLFGEGFGAMINGRALIENTFLWAFWKLGVAGVTFWLLPLALCTWFFAQIPRRGSNRLAGAYYCGVLLVYIETATNPYLNNPIGLSFVMIAMFSLQTLSSESESEVTGRDLALPLPAEVRR